MGVLDQGLIDFDPEVAELIGKELERQRNGLEMIASENHAPLAVMEAQGSVLTNKYANKYAEGYPGRRGLTTLTQAKACRTTGCGRVVVVEGRFG